MQKIIDFIKLFIELRLKPQTVQAPVVVPEPIPVKEPVETAPVVKIPTAGERLYAMAKACLGTDASPNDIAPDEYGCMETVDTIHFDAFGIYINGTKDKVTVSTQEGFKELQRNPDFIPVAIPQIGDIIISPTGWGTNPLIPNGHTGYVGKFGILSNDSESGKFAENYTLASWRMRYSTIGGYPVLFFRRIIN